MKIIYTHGKVEDNKNSVFLAGPTPRSDDVVSWRIEAIKLLEENGYDGLVYSPEHPDGQKAWAELPYPAEWEHRAIHSCGILMFWIPRNMKNMPALTTNVEFGHFIPRKYSVYGHPKDAENVKYLDWMYKKYYNRTIHTTLRNTVSDVANSKVSIDI